MEHITRDAAFRAAGVDLSDDIDAAPETPYIPERRQTSPLLAQLIALRAQVDAMIALVSAVSMAPRSSTSTSAPSDPTAVDRAPRTFGTQSS